ncbi:MAG: M3 family oligoendopeptidase [Planctomycetota bacterium]
MQITKTPDVDVPAPRILPKDFDPSDASAIEAQARELLDRPLAGVVDWTTWIYDWGQLGSFISGGYSRCRIAFDRKTDDTAAGEALRAFRTEALPVWERLDDELNRRFLGSPVLDELDGELDVLVRDRKRSRDLYRAENIELISEDRRIVAEWKKLVGGALVEIDGKKCTQAEAQTRLSDPDREVRKSTFLAISDKRSTLREGVDDLLDEVLEVRAQAARNAGFENFRDFAHAHQMRFDYTPDDCVEFQKAVETVVVPAVRDLETTRREAMELDTLRPWDAAMNPWARSPEPLFQPGDDYIRFVRSLFDAVDPSFARDFDILIRNGLIDVVARPAKSPGGYNSMIGDIRLPFIFGNTAGDPSDLRFLLHEGGHAFHSLAARNQRVARYMHAPAEFCEVASMAMEHFGIERLERLCGEEHAAPIVRHHFEQAIRMLPRIAHVDAFQHFIFTTDHTRDERRAKWAELASRFTPDIDWSGVEWARDDQWQAIPHLFSHPMYYIAYGIAQLGALQVWRASREDFAAAIAAYRRALDLGGSRPLPQLFEAAGARLSMDESTFREIVAAVMERVGE